MSNRASTRIEFFSFGKQFACFPASFMKFIIQNISLQKNSLLLTCFFLLASPHILLPSERKQEGSRKEAKEKQERSRVIYIN